MSKNQELFAKRLAALLLAQMGILPRRTLGLKEDKEGFQSVGEIFQSESYWKNKIKDWKNFKNKHVK